MNLHDRGKCIVEKLAFNNIRSSYCVNKGKLYITLEDVGKIVSNCKNEHKFDFYKVSIKQLHRNELGF